MLLPINSPCNLWSIVSVEEADVEDLRGVDLMLFWLMLGRSSPRRSIIPFTRLQTHSLYVNIWAPLALYSAKCENTLPSIKSLLIDQYGCSIKSACVRVCVCLCTFPLLSTTWISLEILAVFYVSLLAGVFLCDWFVGVCVYVCVWLRMWIGDMLTTARGEMEQVGGNLVWLVGPHTDIWVVFKPSCPDWGWHFEKGALCGLP